MIDAAPRRGAIRLLGLDVDGVLTDNGIFVGPVDGQPVELKRFDIQDGLGHVLMRTAGIPVVWVSGRHSEATTARARELRVEEVLQVPGPGKLEAFGGCSTRRGIALGGGGLRGRRPGRPAGAAPGRPADRGGQRRGRGQGRRRLRHPRAPAATARCARSIEALLKARGRVARAARALLLGAGGARVG